MEGWRYAKIRRGDIGRRNGTAAASHGGAGVPGDEKGASQHRSGYGISALPAGSRKKTILWRRSILNANVSKLLNEQINKEFYSAYLYLDFANYYAAVGLDGFENWYRVQAQEERDHAMLFYQYLQNNGEGVTFEAVAKPEWERGDHMTPLKKALEHEKLVTASIDAIYAAAYEAKDFRAMQMLDWFIKEQGEEEKNAADLITKMELFGGDSKGLYMLNNELKARVYTAPSMTME